MASAGSQSHEVARAIETPVLDRRLMVSVSVSIMPEAEGEAGVMATCHPGKGPPDPPG